MPRVGFEPITPVFERVKTVHPFDRAATVIGSLMDYAACYLLFLVQSFYGSTNIPNVTHLPFEGKSVWKLEKMLDFAICC
jgi:hypothetical protein